MWSKKKILIGIGVPLVAFFIVIGVALFLIFGHNESQAVAPKHGLKLVIDHDGGADDALAITIILLNEKYHKGTSQAVAPKPGLKLVIDHDGGADDALAITMSLLYEKYHNGPQVVALTTCFGNINESQAVINSARILELVDRTDIPIFSGAQKALIYGIESDYFFGYDGLGDTGYFRPEPVQVENVQAAIGLIELSKLYAGDLIVMAIGPLTNIALAIRLDPDFIGRLVQLYVGAGHIYSKAQPNPEFNADMDPEAYYIVADAAEVDKVTLVPFSQIFASLNISKEWRKNVLGAINTPVMKALNTFERISFATAQYWILLDPAVAAIVLDKSVVGEFRYTKNGIILCGAERGINTNDLTSTDPNARVVYSALVDRYKDLLIEIYSSEV